MKSFKEYLEEQKEKSIKRAKNHLKKKKDKILEDNKSSESKTTKRLLEVYLNNSKIKTESPEKITEQIFKDLEEVDKLKDENKVRALVYESIKPSSSKENVKNLNEKEKLAAYDSILEIKRNYSSENNMEHFRDIINEKALNYGLDSSNIIKALEADNPHWKKIDEEEEDDPCWDDYEMVGMKKKDGKEVPNCVPENESLEEHEDYSGYVERWREKGYDIRVHEDEPEEGQIVFKVTGPGVDDSITEIETGVYIPDSMDKEYSSFDKAMEALVDSESGQPAVLEKEHTNSTEKIEWDNVFQVVYDSAKDVFGEENVDEKKLDKVMDDIEQYNPKDTEDAIQIGINMLRSGYQSESINEGKKLKENIQEGEKVGFVHSSMRGKTGTVRKIDENNNAKVHVPGEGSYKVKLKGLKQLGEENHSSILGSEQEDNDEKDELTEGLRRLAGLK